MRPDHEAAVPAEHLTSRPEALPINAWRHLTAALPRRSTQSIFHAGVAHLVRIPVASCSPPRTAWAQPNHAEQGVSSTLHRLTPPARHDCLRQAVRGGEHDRSFFSSSLGASRPLFLLVSRTDPGKNWCCTARGWKEKESSPDRQAAKENEKKLRSCSPRMTCQRRPCFSWGCKRKACLHPQEKHGSPPGRPYGENTKAPVCTGRVESQKAKAASRAARGVPRAEGFGRRGLCGRIGAARAFGGLASRRTSTGYPHRVTEHRAREHDTRGHRVRGHRVRERRAGERRAEGHAPGSGRRRASGPRTEGV
ncbi:hypothetical protein JOE68_001207 [Saccharothrix algeriensis]|uniref:Uncharacterized protein n=1 Tax=Saccharothrix algeriensis TaxID=173560 RepID=A0ABS2S275_9PSEU|nr:hypothetical protein [Saccharothrix algeriensis]